MTPLIGVKLSSRIESASFYSSQKLSTLLINIRMEVKDQNDLSSKHQRLLTEYQRLRGQVVVLKRAVLEEQAANQELKVQVKSHDQSLRKAEQEIECLEFRNQQLIKRVSILQDDLEQISKSKPLKGQKNQVSQSHVSPDISVINSELSCKIEENKELHMKLQSVQMMSNQTVDDLNAEISKIRCESGGKVKELQEIAEKQRDEVNKLHQDKTKLEKKVTILEDQLSKAAIVVQK